MQAAGLSRGAGGITPSHNSEGIKSGSIKLGTGSLRLFFVQDAFAFYDSDHDGIINAHELSLILRSIGQNPTEAELQVSYILFF